MPNKKLLVVDIAAFGWNMANRLPGFSQAEAVFPALTSVAQASFRTAAPPSAHGLVANGLFFRDLRKVLFWEQSAHLVEGGRIWDRFRSGGGRVGMMFWQQSMGESVDLIVTPAPIHKHSGGMIQACYTYPPALERRINEAVGRPFSLFNYWGPLANRKSSDWIVASIGAVMAMEDVAPELLLTYIPHLDYDLQRYGPNGEPAKKALAVVRGYLEQLEAACSDHGYDFIFVGDYAIEPVQRGAIFPNRALRESDLFTTRHIQKMEYADFFASDAFAVVDHQVAHVYCRDAKATKAAADLLATVPGVAAVLDRQGQENRHLRHPRGGELLIVAEPGAWFAYPWFEKKQAPDYASHVDIHNKPGYDPCELFFGWPPLSVSFDTRRIRGSHGNIGHGYEIGWRSSFPINPSPRTFLEIAAAARDWLETAQ